MFGRRSWRPGADVRLAGRPFRYVACLKRDFFSENHVVEPLDAGPRQVLKLSRPLGFLARRERARYRRAAGIEGIPALGPAQGEHWLLHEYVEGRTLDYERPVSPDFYDRLEAIIRALHARGLIYLDLSKRDNVIVRPDGTPALIDFQISLLFARPGGRIFEGLARADLYQVFKHRRRHYMSRGADDDRAGRDRSAAHRLHRRLLRDPWRAFKHRFIPAWW
jgi:hypothetical protein